MFYHILRQVKARLHCLETVFTCHGRTHCQVSRTVADPSVQYSIRCPFAGHSNVNRNHFTVKSGCQIIHRASLLPQGSCYRFGDRCVRLTDSLGYHAVICAENDKASLFQENVRASCHGCDSADRCFQLTQTAQGLRQTVPTFLCLLADRRISSMYGIRQGSKI